MIGVVESWVAPLMQGPRFVGPTPLVGASEMGPGRPAPFPAAAPRWAGHAARRVGCARGLTFK